jgi:Zn-dependent M28 family amino/carboxypeptidase
MATFGLVGLSGQTAGDPQARASFHATIDPVVDALWTAFDERAALDHVQFISQYWRLPGNAGYNASIDRIRDRLVSAGFAASASGTAPRVAVEEYANPGHAWEYTTGNVAIVRPGAQDEVVLSRDKDRLALCINSFSTAPDGVVARLVDVGAGRDADYAGKDVKGAVALGDGDAGALWRKAVLEGGAIGVISTALPSYLDVDPPDATVHTPRDQWDILQWSSIPYDESRKGFGFKSTPRAAARLRRALTSTSGAAAASVRVTIASRFSTAPVRSLIAEIPGRIVPGERIVIAAHVQEPGANDNASGVATGAEMAVALAKAIREGRVPPPARTLTFLFITEIAGSRQWLQKGSGSDPGLTPRATGAAGQVPVGSDLGLTPPGPNRALQVKYMFSMDMTGEDVTKTGGTFLIERFPDPGAVWDRPWDPHTQWGRGNVKAENLKGDLITDAHLAVCQRVARKTGWDVRTNPYEGGSDHTVFGAAGIPSVLDWHFTDRYYHTNFDTPDKTSPAEMKNVGVAVAATAWLFGSATEAVALDVARVVASAGEARLAKEQTDGATLPSAALVIPAWRKWYAEAVRSAGRLVVGTPSPDFAGRLRTLAEPFDSPSR